MRQNIQRLVDTISPFDSTERTHLAFAQQWLRTTDQIFRIAKPATPDPHLVAYFLPIDLITQQILLADHRKSGLWLPPGGHVEPNEHPQDTVKREAQEELGISADFLSPDPFFLTVTQTVGETAGHTDVTLWYLLKGDASESLNYDREEFHTIRWFALSELPLERTDPHMGRLVQKLATRIPAEQNATVPTLGRS